jgi:hypothetical protein
MEIRTPPRFEDFASVSEWKQARAYYFKNLPRRDRTPKTIERLVYVDREVEVIREVERIVHVDVPAEVEIPDFLRYDPLSEFLANEAKPGETDEATLDRLRAEIADLFALQRGDRLSDSEGERLRYLTSHIKGMGD